MLSTKMKLHGMARQTDRQKDQVKPMSPPQADTDITEYKNIISGYEVQAMISGVHECQFHLPVTVNIPIHPPSTS